MSRQGESPKVKRTRFQAQSTDPVNPAEGDVFRSDGTARAEGLWEYRQGSWQLVAPRVSGLIQGDNASFDGSVGDWVAYADAAGTVPVDGTGGSPTLTVTRTTSSPLKGSASLLITKDSNNRQGEGGSLDLSVDTQYRGKPVSLSFYYEADSGFDFGSAADPVANPSDLGIYFYDVTNSKLLTPSQVGIHGGGFFETLLQIPSNCASLRVIGHVQTTSAVAWTFKADSFKLDFAPNQTVSNMSDWIDAGPLIIDATTTAPTKGTTTIDRVLYRYVGDTAHIKMEYDQNAAGTAGSGTYIFRLPAEIGQIDTSKVTTNSDLLAASNPELYVASVGYGGWGSPGAGYHISVHAYDETGFVMVLDQKGNNSANYFGSTFGSFNFTDRGFSVDIKVPIKGRTSGTAYPAAIGLNTKAVMRAQKDGGGVTAGVNIASWLTPEKDSLNAFDSSTGVYTVKSPGDYYIHGMLKATTATPFETRILVNGTLRASNSGANGTNGFSECSAIITDLKYGDQIALQSTGSITLNAAAGNNNYLEINKLGSEQQPYAPRIAYLKDVKSQGTAGGTFTQSAWQTRDLNTLSGDQSFISLSSNQFTLQPGTYHIKIDAPACQVNRHKAKLRNITDASDTIIGVSAYNLAGVDTSQTNATVEDTITISAAKTFEVQHYCGSTQTGYGFGVESNIAGTPEVYTTVKITKVL